MSCFSKGTPSPIDETNFPSLDESIGKPTEKNVLSQFPIEIIERSGFVDSSRKTLCATQGELSKKKSSILTTVSSALCCLPLCGLSKSSQITIQPGQR